jgi:hypothetical protein
MHKNSESTTSSKPEPFQWLFRAYFTDGTTLEQTHADVSESQPDKPAIAEVLQRKDTLDRFELRHIDGRQVVTVNLHNGDFTVNGTRLQAHEQSFDPNIYPLSLVYYRETRIMQNFYPHSGASSLNDDEVAGRPRHFVSRYYIGWWTEVEGNNMQVALAIPETAINN